MVDQPPTFPIHDKHGRTYKLRVVADDENWLKAYVYDSRNTAGRLNIVYNSPDEWEITDLVLFEESPQIMNRGLWLLLTVIGRKPHPIDYRFRGLGSALLKFVDELARQRHAKRIIGKIVSKDYNPWPELPNWYARHSFTVTPRTSDDEPGTVAHISKEISPRE